MPAAKTHTHIGSVIRSRREVAGMSQEALAAEADVHRTYVSQLERGIGNPSLDVLGRIAAVLGSSLTSIVAEWEGESPR